MIKKLLLIFLFSICAIGYRSESIMQMIGMAKAIPTPQSYSIESLTVAEKPTGISLTQYDELAKTDPDAYHKLFRGHQPEQERSELDKLINLFTHLKYE